MEHRCGYVALIGRPNAGKSTLVNRILGNKLAITSNKPQTTRNRIVGIHTDDTTQLVLIDTPGIHEAWTELNKAMVRHSLDAITDLVDEEENKLLAHTGKSTRVTAPKGGGARKGKKKAGGGGKKGKKGKKGGKKKKGGGKKKKKKKKKK